VFLKFLESYRQLVAKVDRFAADVSERYASQLACRRGCDACCTHIGVFAVEALVLALALSALPPEEAAGLRKRAERMREGADCPLLAEGVCLLYAARPIICRTQGLPLLVTEGEGRRVDHCPLNFRDVEAISGAAVLDLETLNQALAAINLLCLRELAGLAEALRLEINTPG
jgi:Fe-S-cluster containining protein